MEANEMSANDLTMNEARSIIGRVNQRAGRGSHPVTMQKLQDALDGKTLAHHPLTSELLGEVNFQLAQRKQPKKQPLPQPKKKPRK